MLDKAGADRTKTNRWAVVAVRAGATAGDAGHAGGIPAGSGDGTADAADPAAGDAGHAGGVPTGGRSNPDAAPPAPVRYRSNPHRGLGGLDLSPADGGGAA